MNIEKIKLGDIIWAKRFKNKLEESSIPNGHQYGPFIVIKKTNKRVYALMATSKPNKTPWDLKLKISKMPINTKETYVFLGKVFIINKNNFIKIMGNISNEDLEIIKKRLYILHNKEYKMKFITNKDLSFNYNMGDIVTYKHKKFYIEKVGYNYVYAYKLKEVKDNTKINIFNKYYEINPILNKIPINKIKLIEVVTLSQRNYIKNILIKIHKIEVGKLITYNKKKYFIYKMDSSGIKAILLSNKYHTKIVIDNNRYFSNLEICDLKKDKEMQVGATNMTILAGFEAEYDPMKESFLGTMRNKVDYMILGQQYVSRNLNNINGINNPNYPIEYANMVAKGIDSGIFDIVAHPDLFMQFRNSMIDEESKKLFDKNSILASQIICEKSRDMGIPLEVNLGLFSKDESMAYPSTIFWKVASEIDGLQVLLGIDSHNLNAIKDIDKSLENVSGIIEMLQDKMVSSNYNPVVARENNPKLQEAYNKGQEKALTFETHMINQTLNSICDNLSDNLTPEEIALGISQGLDMTMKDCVRYANAKDKVIVDEITKIGNNPNMPMEEKKIKASRKKKAVEETNQVLKNQQSAIENAKNNVLNSMNIGCQSKEEFVNMATQMIEYGSTAKETHKAKIENQITEFQATKDISNTIVNTKSPTLVRKQNPDNYNNNSGFANTLAIILVVTFIASFVAVITYTICSKW